MSSDPRRIVLTMKWGTLYGAEYVNVLHHACRENIEGDFRFVCLTDDASGLDDGIEAFPIPDMGLAPEDYGPGAWPKLAVFKRTLYDLHGRALFIDLDMVILGDLTPFFEVEGDFVVLDSAPWRGRKAPEVMTCIFAFDIGGLPQIADRIRTDRDGAVAQYQNEQDFVAGTLDDIRYWPQDWIVSFKRHLRRPLILDRFLAPRQAPEGTRVIAFHGRPRPIALIRDEGGNWDTAPHHGRGAVGWMQDYWTRHGGTI